MYPSPGLEARMLNGESEQCIKSELKMCNKVRGFHRAVRKFIAKIQMTFPNCADINLCLHSYLFPSQTELKVIGHRNTYVPPKLKVINNCVRRFSDRYFKA